MFAKFKKCFGKIAAVAVVLSCVVSNAAAMSMPPSNEVPERIVSLSPAATEILFAVGAGEKVVAVDAFSDYPEEAKNIEKVGGFDGKTLSIEKIISFEPDFICLTAGMHDFLIESLEKYGIKYYISNGNSVESVLIDIAEIGAITGNSKQAKKVIKEITDNIESVEKSESVQLSVYYEVWNSPYMSIGGNTFISDVIAKAGGKNIFAELSDWPAVSEESIIAANPDVIIIPASSGVTAESVAGRSGWAEIDAVKNNKIFIVDDNLYSRPSPRIGQTIRHLNELLNK